jgi:G3E family GTPase
LALGGSWKGFSTVATADPGGAEMVAAPLDVTCAQQIAYADRILVNKVDLIGGDAGSIVAIIQVGLSS